MGLQMLIVIVASLLLVGFIDVFVNWYGKYLFQYLPFAKLRVLFRRLLWVVLAILFWLNFWIRHTQQSLDISYFLFVGFIYSVKGLIYAFVKSNNWR